MEVLKAYKFRVYPDSAQLERFAQCCGVARYAWNWTLAKCKEDWEAALQKAKDANDFELVKDKKGKEFKRYKVKSPGVSRGKLYKAFVEHHRISAAEKRAVAEDHPFAWLCDMHSHVYSYPIEDVPKAYKAWWRERKKGNFEFGPPKFKSKNKSRDSFRIQINERMIQGNKIRVPGVGLMKCKPNPSEVLDDARPKVVTISRTADRWYASIGYATEQALPQRLDDGPSRVIGVDLGLNALITMSNGETIAPSHALERNLRRLARLNRQLRRKEKGSKRREKAKIRLQRLHATIAEMRSDYLHKASRKLVDSADLIIVEGFDVKKLVSKRVDRRERRRNMADASWGELRRQLEYKSAWSGTEILVLGKLEPTDQTCSRCGALNKMPDNTSKYECSACHLEITRQLNTARLLESFGRGNPPEGTGGHPETDARGLFGSDSASAETNQAGRSANAHPAVPPEASASGAGGFLRKEKMKATKKKTKRSRKTSSQRRETPRAKTKHENTLQEPRSGV